MARRIAIFFLAAALFFAIAPQSSAATARQRPDQRAAAQKEFASFIDGFFAGLQKEWNVPGLVFVAVRDGAVLYSHGYGYADVGDRIPVDSAKTIFRVGSVSKIVTAMAVVQLAERGRIDLDADVNEYTRKWKVPEAFGAPITLRNLLTHTAGFDDRSLEIGAASSSDERGFAGKLSSLMPARYAPPGESYSYSNMSYMLAGAIVERYSHQQFASAIQKRIFQPLGMTSSSFAISAATLPRLATGYDSHGHKLPLQYYYPVPALGMLSTGNDMARLMLCALDSGKLGGKRVLGSVFANGMFKTQFTPNPKIDGAALGYYERRVCGLRTLQHSGDVGGYSSLLVLIPEKNFGFFFAANTYDAPFRDDLTEAIIKRYWPPIGVVQPQLPNLPTPPVSLEGFYRHNRVARHTAEKAYEILAPQIQVRTGEDGVNLRYTEDGNEEWWSSTIEPMLFARNESDGRHFLHFKADADGNVKTMSIRDVYYTYDKLPPYESKPWIAVAAAIFCAAAVFSLFGTLLGGAINRGKLPWEKGVSAATELWALSLIFWVVQIAFVAALIVADYYYGGAYEVLVPYQVKALFLIPMAGGLVLAWLWFRILGTLFDPEHLLLEKLMLVSLAVINTCYMFFLADWRLLGFMF